MKIETPKQIIPIPYFFVIATLLPIFLIVFLLPAYPDSEFYLKINDFLDSHLLGQVGYWSSKFPFSSKVAANYISVVGPVLALVFFVKVYHGLVMDPEQYKDHTIVKFIFSAVVMLSFIFFIVHINYFSSVDLGEQSRRWRYLGANVLSYGLFSSGWLFVLYGMTLFSYGCFIYLPRLLIKRYNKK